MSAARRQKRPRRVRLSREDWLSKARNALIAGGIDAVKIGRLAAELNVTRGGFYWHFRNREDLLEALLDSWERATTALFESVLEGHHPSGMDEFLALCNLWIGEEAYSPAYDSAVRDWARISERASCAVHRVDARRIGLIQRIFLDLGYEEREAFIRARVTYFHQVGYYALDLGETREERRAFLPLYVKVLTGLTPPPLGDPEEVA